MFYKISISKLRLFAFGNFFFLFVICSFFQNADAQTSTSNRSLLWKITGKSAESPSYLFGTMHLICSKDFFWTDKMQQCITKSNRVCFEMNLNDSAVIMQASMAMLDFSGKKLSEYFSKEQYATISAYFKDSLGMEMEMLQQLKPFALQSFLVMKMQDCTDAIAYEDTLMKIALHHKLEITGLETPNEQIDVLQSQPIDSVIHDIIDAIKNRSGSEKDFQEMVALYKNQDLPGLYEYTLKSGGMKDEMGMFLDDRNKKWINRMTNQMNSGSVFFAVGAAHLWGENGVIRLLQQSGYKVEAVR